MFHGVVLNLGDDLPGDDGVSRQGNDAKEGRQGLRLGDGRQGRPSLLPIPIEAPFQVLLQGAHGTGGISPLQADFPVEVGPDRGGLIGQDPQECLQVAGLESLFFQQGEGLGITSLICILLQL